MYTAAFTSCHPLGTGEVTGPPTRGRAEKEGKASWGRLGLPALLHTCALPPLALPCLGSLRPLDVEFLQRLCRTVNVVPVIARADSLTIDEREAFRSRVTRVPGVLGWCQCGREQGEQRGLRPPVCWPRSNRT